MVAKARKNWLSLLVGAAGALLTSTWANPARAQSVLRVPGLRPNYAVELEPHLLLSPFDAPDDPSGDGYGFGARATIEVAPEGFIQNLNDSVGIGLGLDWVHYDALRGRGSCERFATTAGGVPVCVETSAHHSSYLFVPVVMQWNFWLHRRWSVFGEPGLALTHRTEGSFGVSPVFSAGGRYHFSDSVALTARVGYPTLSLGISFLF